MNDEIVDEIHRIRKQTYEETKNLTPQELVSYFHDSSKDVREQIAKRRARKGVENFSNRHETVGQ